MITSSQRELQHGQNERDDAEHFSVQFFIFWYSARLLILEADEQTKMERLSTKLNSQLPSDRISFDIIGNIQGSHNGAGKSVIV